MPKVIKSGSVTEEKNLFVLSLPVIDSVTEEKKIAQIDDLDFFKNLDMLPKDDGEDERYYQIDTMVNTDNDAYKKYFINLVSNEEQEDSSDGEFEKSQEGTDGEQIEDSEHKPSANGLESVEELKQSMLEEAEQQAKNIVDAAKKEAESLRMKLVAEISEAEVKKELAKNIAQSTIDDANHEADQIIDNANTAATEIQQKAKNDGFAAGREDGYKQGIENGLEEGKRIGFEDGEKKGFSSGEEKGKIEGQQKAYEEMSKQLAEASQRAKGILLEAEKEKIKIINSSDNQIIEIAMSVASKILNKEFSENPFAVLQIVKEAVLKVSDQPRIFITVSPTNYDLINMALSEIKKTLGSKQEISVVADSTLGNADVIVGTGGSGDVDARLETQLNEIRKTIEMVIR